jgi:hypothetical protein
MDMKKSHRMAHPLTMQATISHNMGTRDQPEPDMTQADAGNAARALAELGLATEMTPRAMRPKIRVKLLIQKPDLEG